jgi:hypothetical protein
MKLHISNSNNRDATIIATSLSAKKTAQPSKAGKPVSFKRFVAAGEGKLHESLSADLGTSFTQ